MAQMGKTAPRAPIGKTDSRKPRRSTRPLLTYLSLLLPLLLAAFIFYNSAQPADTSSAQSGVIVDYVLEAVHHTTATASPDLADRVTTIVRKSAHFLEYAAFGLSLANCWVRWCPKKRKLTDPATPRNLANSHKTANPRKTANSANNKTAARELADLHPAFAIGALYAVSDEIHQIFVPGRSCELRDILIDSAGVLVGILAFQLLRRTYSALRQTYPALRRAYSAHRQSHSSRKTAHKNRQNACEKPAK